jgi:pimeloyl-ACP methyl ester carboxylesterase
MLSATGLAQDLPRLRVAEVVSTIDHAVQPVGVWAPPLAKTEPTPILVSLHSWSSDYRQDRSPWLEQAVLRGWIYIQPNFRGINDHPEACGSPLAIQDVIDALDWAQRTFQVDSTRVYMAGVSGGGHMTMQMAAHHPNRFSAASAWCGPTDLADWYRFHTSTGEPGKYAVMIAACCGGPPGASAEIDAEYSARSPVFHLGNVGDLHLEIVTGVQDGKTGSVPIHHSLRAFNAVAAAHDEPLITNDEMDSLWETGRSSTSGTDLLEPGETYPREIHLRRTAGNTRVTIFEGTHEALPDAACAWLASKRRATVVPSE